MGLLFGAWFSLSWTLLLPLAAMEPQDQQASVEPPPLGVPRELREDEVQAGWLELFDGETLQGWKNEGDANFVVQEGRIVADTGTAPCLLRTTTQFDDYELTVDFRFTETTNSGVFLRTPPTPTNPTVDCFEVNIAQPTVSPFPTGSLVGREANPIELDTDQWHRMSMTIQGGSLRVIVDGERITQVDSAIPRGTRVHRSAIQRGTRGILQRVRPASPSQRSAAPGFEPLANRSDSRIAHDRWRRRIRIHVERWCWLC
ncbi:MAG: DUF1080 domain-containing protein [Pirellulaceae bacterium]